MRIRPGRMRSLGSSLAIVAFCGAACLILSPAASGRHGKRASCGPARAQTVVADRVARVYRVPAGHGPFGNLYDYYGCALGNAKPRLVARAASRPRGVRVYGCGGQGCWLVTAIRLVGAKVGVIVEYHGIDFVDGTLTVRDLADDRVLHRFRTDWIAPGYGVRLITCVLAPSGNVAWSTETSSAPGHHGIIHRAVGKAFSTLDSGPNVVASSLRLRGDTLEWIDGSEQRRASLT